MTSTSLSGGASPVREGPQIPALRSPNSGTCSRTPWMRYRKNITGSRSCGSSQYQTASPSILWMNRATRLVFP
jgi:hypothetical protein